MRPMESGQLSLSRLGGLRPVELYVLRTYTDRDAGTVHRTYYFSDRFVEYEYGGGGVQQFLPLVRSHRGPDLHLASHVQDSGAKLSRRLSVVLSNLQLETGTYLATDLRTTNLRRATIEMAQVLLPATDGDRDLVTPFAGTEHTVLFRGEVSAVQRIDADVIELDFESVETRVPWRYALLPGTDPLDFGARFPLPYGRAKRVQLVGLDVGGFTTIAGATTATDTTILVTSTELLSAAGIGYANGERITWAGKTATSLTGVARGSSGTTALEHAPGTTLLEVKDSTFVAAGFGVSAIGEVYVRQYSGELVRVVGAVTKNVADTAAPGHSGVTLATVRLPVAQFESIIQQLETTVALPNQPQVSGGTVAGVNILTLDGDNVVLGGFAQSAAPMNGFGNTGWLVPRNFPFESISLGPVSGTSKIFSFPAPPGGSAGIAQTITVRAYNSGADGVYRIEDSGNNALSANFTVPASTPPESPFTFSFSPPDVSAGNSTLGVFTGKLRHVSGDTLSAFELERTMTVIQTVQIDASSIQIGGTAQTKAKIGATSSRGTGYRLQLFADVDGPVAPDGTYTVPSGTLLEAMPDCIRHFAAAFCGLGAGAIDSTSFTAAAASVAPNAHAFDARDFGEAYYAILARAAWEARLNVVELERAAGAQLFLYGANRQYRFPGPVEVVDGFASIEERGRRSEEIVTRIRALYLRDQSRGGRLDRDAYAGAVSIDKSGTPTAKPTAAQLLAAEQRWGRNDSRTLLLASIRDAATLIDVAGYFAWEWIRDSREWTVRGVPWTVSYRLEPCDVIELRSIPWAPGEEWHARVLGVSWNPDTGQRDLSLIELSASSAVASLVARATVTANAVVQATVLASASLVARATVIATATQAVVPASAALSARATITAALRGGVELAAAALSAAATITVGTNLDGDSGEILGQTPETVAGEPQSLAQHHTVEFQTNESLVGTTATLGVANSWSLALWLRPEVVGLTVAETAIELAGVAVVLNRISVGVRGATANDPIRVELNDSAGALFKSYTWDSQVSTNVWVHLVITWDGTTLVLYINGVAVSPTATATNNAGTMTDTTRVVTIGSTQGGAEFWDGEVHTAALWNAVLTANAVRQLFNQGDGASMNLLRDDDDYAVAANLQHWWRPGYLLNAIGADFATAGTPITLT